jgi:glycosyltransferase involved in cell wall biosynthesis
LSERRYRILYICSHPVPYVSPLFRHIALDPRLDLQVAYCALAGVKAMHDPEFNTTVQWDVRLLDGFPWTEVPNRGTGGLDFFGLYNPGIWRLIRQGNFDAVTCFTGYLRASFWITFLACKFSHTAFLFGTDTFTVAARDGRSWKPFIKRFLWPYLYRLADQTIVGSSPGRELMLSLGIQPDRISLIPNTVDNDWWISQSSRVDREAVRSVWGANSQTSIILFCAKLQPWKRPGDLLQAFARSNLRDALLVYAGDGPLRQELEREASRLGVSEKVRFLGFLNQTRLPAAYAAADLMVLPSVYEAFGLVVNEASCCGCAAVVSNQVGAASDLVAPVDPCLVFPFGDVEALSALLRELCGNRERLRQLGQAAKERMTSWSVQDAVDATVEAVTAAVHHCQR